MVFAWLLLTTMFLFTIYWGTLHSKRPPLNTTDANATNTTNTTTTTTQRIIIRAKIVDTTMNPELTNITSSPSKRHLTDWRRLPDETHTKDLPAYLHNWLF